MPNVTSTTQLNLFSVVRSAIRTDTELAGRFPPNHFYEFEPKLKGGASLPLWVVKTANTDLTGATVDNLTRMKSFSVVVLLKMDYLAHDKATNYLSRAVAAIEANESLFNASGYYYPQASVESVEDEIEDQKQIIVGIIRLELRGAV
jgi:hypothetical protein